MGEKTLNIRIKNKYDTEANWTKNNPILLAGETAYSSDKSGKYKIGDGTHKWSELSYAKADLVKSDVTTALGYTPPTNNTWRGVQNNLTSTATDQSLSAYQGKVLNDKIDAIQVGGRNLLINTSTNKSTTVNTVGTSNGFTTFDPYSTNNNTTLKDLGFKSGDNVTISFDWSISKNGSLDIVYGNFRIEWVKSGNYLGLIKNPVDVFSSTNTSGKVIITTTLDNAFLDANAVRIRIDNSTLIFTISKMKLEKGNKATDWTPAPEDIDTTYIKGLSVSGRTITYTKGDGTTGIITTQDTNTTYSTGTASALGLTKLYTGTGTGTDGTMTQKAITDALNGKAASSHTHSYLPLSGGTLTGNLNLKPASGEGGEIHLDASTANRTENGIILDQQGGNFRIFGVPSADGTTKTGSGTPLVINPYSKTITGGYTLTGALSGNASTATKATQDSAGQQINTTYIKGLSVSGKTITYTKGNGTTGTITTQDTTYSDVTTSAHGLMTAADKKKLDGIATGANNYSHPTTSGNKHIPAGGSSGQILRWSADGTAVWGADNNTTYSTGTASTSGLTKLYTGTGTATDGTMTQAAIKTALDGKSATGHTHNYAGSGSSGGAANSAIKLNTARNITIGNSTKSFDGTTNLSWSLNEIGIPTKSDIAACVVMYGGTTLSSSATVTDSTAQYKVISRSTGSTGNIFTKSVTLPKGLYSVMIRMKVSTISSSSNVFKLTIVDGSTTTTKYIKPNMFKAENSYTTLGTAVENTSGTLKITLNVYSTLSNQTVCVDYLAIAPTMVGVTSIA